MSEKISERLTAIELRLSKIELSLPQPQASTRTASVQSPLASIPVSKPQNPTSNTSRPTTNASGTDTPNASGTSQILGYGGGAALVIAAVYVIVLAVDNGWLTPARQVLSVVLAGLGMTIGGVLLKDSDSKYMALLPGTGMVLLFLAIFGGHSFYHIIPTPLALIALATTTGVAMSLCVYFKSEMLAYFAVFGTYLGPYGMSQSFPGIVPLFAYFSFWSVLFCVFSTTVGRRGIYLSALYLGLIGFHALSGDSSNWPLILTFQLAQLIIFGLGAVRFSITQNRPMSKDEGLAHLPALFIFYFLQYSILAHYAPALAPWIAVGSALFLLGLQLTAVKMLPRQNSVSALLAAAYFALVLFHTVYVESLQNDVRIWLGPIFLLIVFFFGARPVLMRNYWPLAWAFGAMATLSMMQQFVGEAAAGGSIQEKIIPLIFSLEFYAAYFLIRIPGLVATRNIAILYLAHVFLMEGLLKSIDHRLGISVAWGALSLFWIVFAFRQKDGKIAQSSLIILAISSAKVLIYDLGDATDLTRIACLIVLGGTLFVSGLMYRKIEASGKSIATGDPAKRDATTPSDPLV